jgi:hypothetical protein
MTARARPGRAPRIRDVVPMVVCLTALVVGCKRPAEDGAPSPSATPEVRAPAPQPEPSTLAAAIGAADLRLEARRGTLQGYDPVLERHRAALEAHFDGKVPFPLAFQVVALGAGRTAVLLQATVGESRPLVWALDSTSAMLWAKEHPLGGVKAGASEASLVGAGDGHVCVAWCNASSNSVALRRWAEDGGAFADYEAFHFDACEALTALYWPHRGWLLAATREGGATVQLITENGVHAFGSDGMSLPWMSRAPATVAFGLDTQDSYLFFRVGQSGGNGSPEYLFANRYGVDGRSMWPGPLSIKRLTHLADPSVRPTVHLGADAALRVTLPAEKTGPDVVDVELLSDGTVRRH